MKPKLVKNTKTIRVPRKKISRHVGAVIRKAIKSAEDQKWTKIIIIGMGKDTGDYHHTIMDYNELVGILENSKLNIHDVNKIVDDYEP